VSLATPPKVQKLRTTLHAKAKGSPGSRFYALYDKVYRRDILEFAYRRCRSNDGAPGVDGRTFEDIAAYGRDRWLDELTTELRERTYRPDPVRRVFIPNERPQGLLYELIAPGRDATSILPPHPNRLRDSSPSPIRITPSAVSALR